MKKFNAYLRLTLSLGALGTLVLPYNQNLLAQTQVQSPTSPTKSTDTQVDKVVINNNGTTHVVASDKLRDVKAITIYTDEQVTSANGTSKELKGKVLIIDSTGVHSYGGKQFLPDDIKQKVDEALKDLELGKDASVEVITTQESSQGGSRSTSSSVSGLRGGRSTSQRTFSIGRGGSASANTVISISEDEATSPTTENGSSANARRQRTCSITARGLSSDRMQALRNSLELTKLKSIGTLQSLDELSKLDGLSDEVKEKLKNIRFDVDDKDSAISISINGLENLEKGTANIKNVKILLKEAGKSNEPMENGEVAVAQEPFTVITTEKNDGKETKRVILKFRGDIPKPPTPPVPPTYSLPTPPVPPTPPAESNTATSPSSQPKLNELRPKELSIYPNPSEDGRFTLRYGLTSDAPVSMRITNIEGREILSEQNLASTAERLIDLSTQGSGTYLVTLLQAGKSTTLKLVVSE